MTEFEPRLQAALDVLFDPAWYAVRYADFLQPGASASDHFMETGLRRGLNPNPLFDASWYAARRGVQAGEALAHFVAEGEAAGLAPGPFFDVAWYRERYPDVAAARVNSLVHYLEFGRHEGRFPSPVFDPATCAPYVHSLEGVRAVHAAWLLSLAPAPTTLSRLLASQEATSFTDPDAVRQIIVEARPAPGSEERTDVIVMGGTPGVFQRSGGVWLAPGGSAGWALAHVTHAIVPRIAYAVQLLGLGELRSADELEQWAAVLTEKTEQTLSPHLLIDETLPADIERRLLSAAGPGATAFRAPARRLIPVERLLTLDLGAAPDLVTSFDRSSS